MSTQFRVCVLVPAGRSVLRFRPVVDVRPTGDRVLPADMDLLRFEIRAAGPGPARLLWREAIPPFIGTPWWQDRILSLADYAGGEVDLRFSATPIDGRGHPLLCPGFARVAVFG